LLAEGYLVMSKFEVRLCIFAIVFVAIYIGAIALTINSRVSTEEKITRIESEAPPPGEGQMMLAELLLPMLILLTVTICFIIVKKRRAKMSLALEEADEEFQ
jgi:H+/gluconate symporter-like permease